MTSFAVVPGCDRDPVECSTRGEAEQKANTHVDLCDECSEDDVVIDDGIEEPEVEVIQHGEDGQEVVADGKGDTEDPTPTNDSAEGMLPATGSMEDPLDTLPGWMITQVSYSDRGDTSTTVNKRGCQVIANYLGLSHETEALVPAHETDFEYAYYKTTVRKPNGDRFTGHGAARADGEDQSESDGWKLDMQAETRSYKRAVKAATGGGVEAFAKERTTGGIE